MPATTQAPPHIPGYAFIQKLGEGTDARVYRYRQRMPNRDVAVKVSRAMPGKHTVKRFLREADYLAALSSHPYVITIHDAGIVDDQLGYLVLEYAPHGSYRELIRRRPLSVDRMLTLGVRLASALHCAHRQGILHRDVKPANVMISHQGLPALTDFGIASIGGLRHEPVGFSLPWAAPEVLRGDSYRQSADLYSLAATLYATLVGRSPFEYGYRPHSPPELARHILESPLPRLGPKRVPPIVESVLARAMAYNPANRHASMLAFARQLQCVQHSLGYSMTAVIAGDVPEYPGLSPPPPAK